MTATTGRPVTEQQFTDAVIQLAKYRGWLVAHFRAGRTVKGWRTPVQGHKGFVDLVLVRPPRIIYAELKTARGVTSREQDHWMEALKNSGAEVHLWRPADLTDTITEALR